MTPGTSDALIIIGWRAACLWTATCAFLGIASCAAPGPQETRVDMHTVTSVVSVPKSVACVLPADIPERPTPAPVAPNATTDQLAAAAAVDAEAYQAYSKLLKDVLVQCTKGAK